MPIINLPIQSIQELQKGTSLANFQRANLEEAFTGSDIKALIIRRDDRRLLKAAREYLLQQSSTQEADPNFKIEYQALDDRPQDPTFVPIINLQTITVSTFRREASGWWPLPTAR